jgi:peptidoglycan/LPS O-acetylase OafA/YrhL
MSAQPRVRELDLLRFVAAAAVMLHHYTGVIYYSAWETSARTVFPTLAPVTSYGYLGVQLFFMISGFVILMSAWGRSPGDFAASRFTRLFPAYWFAVCLTLLVFLSTGRSSGWPVSDQGPIMRFLPNLTMLQTGIGVPDSESVYWTLWVELHFYALMALLVWRGVTYRSCVTFMGVWLLASVFAQEAGHKLLSAVLIPIYAPFFVAGMAFFLMFRYGPNLVLWLFIGVSWALGVYYSVHNISGFVAWPGRDYHVIPAVLTAFFLIMWMVATRRLRWLNWSGLTVLGAMTYPLYLTHETISRPIIETLRTRQDRWTVLAIALVTALLLAYLIHRHLEQPLQRWLRPRLDAALAQIRFSVPAEPVPPVPAPREADGQTAAIP